MPVCYNSLALQWYCLTVPRVTDGSEGRHQGLAALQAAGGREARLPVAGEDAAGQKADPHMQVSRL